MLQCCTVCPGWLAGCCHGSERWQDPPPALPCMSVIRKVCAACTRIFNPLVRTSPTHYILADGVRQDALCCCFFTLSSDILWARSVSEETVPAVRLKVVSTVQSDCFYPLYFILSYKRHCLPRPDEYLMGICCFICMLYNMGLYDHNSSREAAVPVIFSTQDICLSQRKAKAGMQVFSSFFSFLFI